MKSFNLTGGSRSGKTLIGNWQEDQVWQEDPLSLKRSSHGTDIITQKGGDQVIMESTAHASFKAEPPRRRKVPPRQARLQNEISRALADEMTQQIATSEDRTMYFTRGRYLDRPQYHEDLKLDYLDEKPITFYSDKNLDKGKSTKFSTPIQDYNGHEIVKDV